MFFINIYPEGSAEGDHEVKIILDQFSEGVRKSAYP